MALAGARRRPSAVVVVPEEEEDGGDDGRLSAGQFRGAFAADSFVSDLLLAAAPHIADTRLVVDSNSSNVGNAEHATDNSSAALQFPGVPTLLAVLMQVTQELAELGTQVDKRIQGLERSVAAEEVAHANDLHELEEGMEQLLDSFSMLDEHVGQVSRTAARIGDRLQSQETQRLRAEEAQQLMEYLMEFNARPGDLRGISRVFKDNNSLTEAATLAKKLRAFAEQPPARSSAPVELLSVEASAPSGNANASMRLRRSSSQSRTLTSDPGGLSVAVANLQQYCNELENRLLDRFQDALQENDVDEMATCAETLVQFNGGHNVMQRFVATRPMFMDVQAMLGGDPNGDVGEGEVRATSGVAQAKAALEPLFASILDEVKEGANIAAQVFPSPPAVMAMLVQRVLEQRVQAALDQLLPDSAAPAADGLSMLEYLRLLQDAYTRTKQLATELTEIGCGELDVQGLADSLFSNHREEYIENELACLKMLGAPTLASATGVVHFADYAIASVQQTKEAVTRCTKLVPQRATCATYIQRLFFVLLEQVGTQVLGSLKTAVEGVMAAIIAVERGGAGGGGKRAATAASAGSTAAATVAESSLRSMFAVISEASAAVPSVHEHYETIISSSVTAVPHSQAACSTELLAFLRVTEEQVTRGLQAALHLVIVQVDRTLLAEQSASDFQPKDAAAMPDHRSTAACTKYAWVSDRAMSAWMCVSGRVTQVVSLRALELLQNTQIVVRKALDEANRQSFLTGLGFRLHSVLLTHIERFIFNSSGGLRLKRDISEYSAFVRSFNSPAVQERFERLSTLINVFIVAPESLRQLVDTTLGLTAQEALRYLKLREDFKSAKIASLFAGL
eukprot:jgi/Chlat1/5040/Chrsp329S04919